MHRILKKDILAENIKLMEVDAPLVSRRCQPGQFVMIRLHEKGERIPLTIADFNRKNKTITLIFQEVGKSTEEMGFLKEGDSILDVIGPLGLATERKKEEKKVICIAGGVGAAPLFPELRHIKELGNYTVTVLGARSKDLLIWEDELKRYSDEFYITTDDGTEGSEGFVSQKLEELLNDASPDDYAYVLAIGPVPMMRATADTTRPYKLPTFVSLNTIMVDGTGMCGSCRVTVDGKVKFACVDGPEFNGHLVDWNELSARQIRYVPQEKEACEHFHRQLEELGIKPE